MISPLPSEGKGRYGRHPDGPFVARILEYRALYRAGKVNGLQYGIAVVQTLSLAQAVLDLPGYCGVLVELDQPGKN